MGIQLKKKREEKKREKGRVRKEKCGKI